MDEALHLLAQLGLWAYVVAGAASLLEAFCITGPLVPGVLVVDAAGVLAQQGVLHLGPLVLAVTLGSVAGGEASWWTGVLARRGLGVWRPEHSAAYRRAEGLFRRHGGLALVLGRFSGPASGLVPFVVGLAGMEHRRFLTWNLVSSLVYAASHLGLGYLLGGAFSLLGALAWPLAILALALVLIVAVVAWLAQRIRRALPFVLSLLGAIGATLRSHPSIRTFTGRHPRLVGLLANRLDPRRFSGLPVTLLALAMGYVALLWSELAFDLVTRDPILEVDLRLAHLLRTFWMPELLRVFAHITALGEPGTVAWLAAAALVWLWVERRPDLMIGLAVSLGGSALTVELLKGAFARPRPPIARFVETSGSFPSGHAAVSVAFYAMLAFAAWRTRRLPAGPALAAALAAALLVGASRLYLVEHYLTDVPGGWLVGTFWLLAGITAAGLSCERRPTPISGPAGRGRPAAALLALALCAGAAWQVAFPSGVPNVSAADTDVPVADVGDLLASGRLPVEATSITGTPLAPVTVLLLARTRDALAAALQAAGWEPVPPPGFGALAQALRALAAGQPRQAAEAVPSFWSARPNDATWRKADAGRGRPMWLRLWRTRFVSADREKRLFVGTVTVDLGFDAGLRWRIDPDLDTPRERLLADLEATGHGTAVRRVPVPRRSLHGPGAGGAWVTDGQAVLVELR